MSPKRSQGIDFLPGPVAFSFCLLTPSPLSSLQDLPASVGLSTVSDCPCLLSAGLGGRSLAPRLLSLWTLGHSLVVRGGPASTQMLKDRMMQWRDEISDKLGMGGGGSSADRSSPDYLSSLVLALPLSPIHTILCSIDSKLVVIPRTWFLLHASVFPPPGIHFPNSVSYQAGQHLPQAFL